VANQMCKRVAPGLFELGADGTSHPTRDVWTPEDVPLLAEAEENCPTGAISLERDS
jgi:ferredoxin